MNEIMDRADEDEGVLAGPDVQVNSFFLVIFKFGVYRESRDFWDFMDLAKKWRDQARGILGTLNSDCGPIF